MLTSIIANEPVSVLGISLATRLGSAAVVLMNTHVGGFIREIRQRVFYRVGWVQEVITGVLSLP